MPFEADLAHALDRTTDSLEPDLTVFLSGAVARGRSRRRRRSAGIVAGVGACAVIAAAGLLIPGALAGTGSGGADMEPVALAMPRTAVTGTQMIHTLEQTFPGSRFSQVTAEGSNPSGPPSAYVATAELVVDDGHGAAFVGISAERLQLPLKVGEADGDGLSCASSPDHMTGGTCSLSQLPSSAAIPGGALVMWEENAADHPVGPVAAQRWTMTVTLKATGAQLQLVEWNSNGSMVGNDTSEPTRVAPPLSEQQAVAALTGATWAPILGAVG